MSIQVSGGGAAAQLTTLGAVQLAAGSTPGYVLTVGSDGHTAAPAAPTGGGGISVADNDLGGLSTTSSSVTDNGLGGIAA